MLSYIPGSIQVLFLIALIIASSVSAQGSEPEFDIVHHVLPSSLRLMTDESGSFNLNITNTGDEPFFVVLVIYQSPQEGASHVDLDPGYLWLGPGESVVVRVTVQSHAQLIQGPMVSDVIIGIFWSPMDDRRMYKDKTYQDGYLFRYEVKDAGIHLQLSDDSQMSLTMPNPKIILVLIISVQFTLFGALLMVNYWRGRGKSINPPTRFKPSREVLYHAAEEGCQEEEEEG